MQTSLSTLYPYLRLSRLHQRTGIYLVFFPALWGLTVAYQGFPPLRAIIIFMVGAVLVRGAGCTVNDLLDRNFDPHVQRTKGRPLASGALTVKQGVLWLGLQLLGAASLLLLLNDLVFKLSLMAVGLLSVYPLLKRVTYWPQLFLGFAMNFSMLMAYASVHQTVSLEIILLYLGSICWTLGYDTIYAYQDKKDDELIGVKSSVRILGGALKPFLVLIYSCCIVLIGSAFLQIKPTNASGMVYGFILSLALYGQIYWCDFNNTARWGQAFRFNTWVGLLVWLALILLYTV
jgi:4-hydroxybenzoate polyprenyl transferase, proteobacterial